jgi:hypothetical protein
MLVGVRSLPVQGNVEEAMERIKTIQVYPLKTPALRAQVKWLDLTPMPQDTTPLTYENEIEFWRELHEVVNSEPPNPRIHNMYGELAALGIEKGKPFQPDPRMTAILQKAAETANAQMRVESFGDRRPDRIVWPDRKWEWGLFVLRTETSTPPTMRTSMLGTSGSIKPSAPRPRCSGAIPTQAHFTGSACVTTREHIWMVEELTN